MGGGIAERARRVLPAVWLGLSLALGVVAAPTLFAALDRAAAGPAAGQMFAIEATLSVVMAGALALIERARSAQRSAANAGSGVSPEVLLVLGALFCTVLGYYAIQPMMEMARAGRGPISFATLHAASTVLYAVKLLLVATLAWRAGAA